MRIEKKELFFSTVGIIIILGWFLYLKNLIAPLLSNVFPFFAMILYNLTLYLGLYLLFSVLNSGSKIQFKVATIAFLIIIGIDIIAAPYLVEKSGEIIKSIDYWFVSTDAGFGALYSLFLPSSLIWFFTYIVTPVFLIFIIPIIFLSSKQIAKALH